MGGLKGTDGELLAEFLETREQAPFEEIVRRHGSLVFGVCRRALGQTQDAEDATQAVFLTLANKAKALRDRDSIAGWLHHVAWNVSLHARRSAALHRKREQEVRVMEHTTENPERAWEQLKPLLDGELDALPEKYRLPLILRYVQGRTEEDAARELGCKTSTLSMRLVHARDLLRGRLARSGVTLTGALLATLMINKAAAAAVSSAVSVSTVKAAALVAAGNVAGTALVSAHVSALVKGGLNAMMWAKLKIAAAVVVAVVAGSAGAGAVAYRALKEEPPPPQESLTRPSPYADEFARIDKQVTEGQLKPEERKMDQIGWVKGIKAGMELARKNGRLLFFFGYDGEGMQLGRC